MYYDPNYIKWGHSQGWRCPGCGRYYSPTTPMCFYCGGNQKTWTAPSTTGVPSDNEWWKYYQNLSTADSAAATGIKQEVTTGSGFTSTKTDKNVTVTAWNSNNITTCDKLCENCDKYEKSCFDGIETTSTKAIISHRKSPEIIFRDGIWWEKYKEE